MKASNKLRLFDIWRASIYNEVGDDGFISMVWSHQDEIDLETAIERAMVAGYEKLTIGEVRQIVAAILFSKGKGSSGVDPLMLDDGDTIH